MGRAREWFDVDRKNHKISTNVGWFGDGEGLGRKCADGMQENLHGCASLLRDTQQWAFNYPRFACASISMQIEEVE